MSEPYNDWMICFKTQIEADAIFMYLEDIPLFYKQIFPRPCGIGCKNRQITREVSKFLKKNMPSFSFTYNIPI